MTFASRLNKFSIGLALISFVSAASAQSLRGVNATLDHKICTAPPASTARGAAPR